MLRRAQSGFSLMEVLVSAAIIATVMIGMSGVLISYSGSRAKTNDLAIAQNLIQAQIDDVLMHNQVENSLISDTQGRSRPIYLLSNVRGTNVLVTRYYYYNFPHFPSGTDHNTYGNVWDDSLLTGSWSTQAINRFDTGTNPGILYDAGGNETTDIRVAKYIARLQVFGTPSSVPNFEQYINGPISASYPHGQYLDEAYSAYYPSAMNYLIADTCVNNASVAQFTQNNADNTNPNSNTYNSFRDKLFVVRIYTMLTYKTGPGSFINSPSGAKQEVAHGYVVINGQVRL